MKSIVCVETTWYKNNPITVQPFLETLRMLEGVSYIRHTCDSVAVLETLMTNFPPRKPGILYFSMHGRKGKIIPGKGTVTLASLAEMMGNRFRGWHVHFACCETINTSNEIFQDFKKNTGASIVSGYLNQVEWIEGYAADMLLLSKAQRYSKPAFLVKSMYNNYSDLMERTGMYIE